MESIFERNYEFIKSLWNMPRHLMSDGFDQALDLVSEKARSEGLKMIIHEYPTGYDCGTWIIPQKWTLRRAVLKETSGKIILDSDKEPLTCVSHSMPFSGKVSREELFKHLYIHPFQQDAIPFVSKYYSRTWGLCCSKRQKEKIINDSYIVEIDTEFSDGTLKVGEIVVEGEFEHSFIMESHLCHPYQINDGPIGVPIGLELLKSLQSNRPHHTFRYLIVPENVGTAAWISKHRSLLPNVKGGLFIEMLALDCPFILNRTFFGDTILDRIFSELVIKNSNDNKVDDFNYGNDERQFNGPGVRVPMLALHRSRMSRTQKDPWNTFLQYHSNLDNMDLVKKEQFDNAYDLISNLVCSFDKFTLRPCNDFVGEPFLSRYNLHADTYIEKDKFSDFCNFMDIIFLVDGKRSMWEISEYLSLDIDTVQLMVTKLVEKGLAHYEP